MKTVILCGGLGTRLSEETQIKPKPMVEIGGRPILWHLLRVYGTQGFKEFVLALGYKGEVIRDYFLHYYARSRDGVVDLSSGVTQFEEARGEDWRVHLMDTGERTMTGGRLKRLEHKLRPHGTFMMTYGDAVARIDIARLLEFHRSHGGLATVTAVRPTARFGALGFDGDRVVEFKEKPQTSEGWINGGFFVFEPGIFDYIEGDETVLEEQPLERLAADGQLFAHRLHDYWQCMDTVRDRNVLNDLWEHGRAPWKTW
ncbi:MAG: glucose-1-phosphate cytidylyltransferase [Gemmatimonadaceae bacterium]|nr:glucose-1-phosphate cytidylyltransferase [Gemmatimonadaceae bacterium]NUO93170.1 glucose-1-phosphate cytidylyltransferase [Gemmatimonadaceae bacterium]NUP54838.1 glucose-1-phosphate cytidylyltransferase [Gemmatimonadaceae bacterium]NUP71826.1 glucose-1-phosphate cytidylyltransferase [Gemmatimonadaceae bacterium]NUR32998.1 glucose-1-phosphate cytidylyltransferase [Gemmatimonadaceae bacterium]